MSQLKYAVQPKYVGWPLWNLLGATGEFVLPDEIPPTLTAQGDYILYHGTSPQGLQGILREGIKRV